MSSEEAGLEGAGEAIEGNAPPSRALDGNEARRVGMDTNSRFGRRKFLERSAMSAGALSLGGALAACGPSSSGSSSSGGGGGGARTVKAGALIPFTGLETHNGKSMQVGVELAAAAINKNGGIAGGQLELLLADTGAQVDQGVQKAQELITQKRADFILGEILSNVRAAIFDVSKKTKTIYINPTFYEGQLCAPYYFSTGGPPNLTIDPLAKHAMANIGKSVYFIASDYVWGTGSTKAAMAAVKANGGTIAGKPTYVPLGKTDFSAEIRSIQAAKPDIVWPFVAGQDGITFLKQLTDAGVRSDVKIVANYIDELIVPALAPETYEGIVNCSTYYMALENPENKAFLAAMEAKYGKDQRITTFGMEMYNALQLMAVGTKGLDGWDKDKAAKGLATARFTGPGGDIGFDPSTQHAGQDVHLAEIQKDASFKMLLTEKNVKPEPGCTI
jgi:ABC-type branched-subunit amino acid transport system substrate-binding protein